MVLNWVDLGVMEYKEAWGLQKRLAEARARSAIPDTLLLVQHPHTYTLGRSGHIENLLMPPAERARRGIQVYEVDRGGDITYHGPGQLVAYPILWLGQAGQDGRLPHADYVGYIRRLESVIIRTLATFGITGQREAGHTGVWIETANGLEKIAAIGVKVNAAGVSTHGLALNIDPDLSYFSGIVPCGIADRGVTSLARSLNGAAPAMAEARKNFLLAFSTEFQCLLHEVAYSDMVLSL